MPAPRRNTPRGSRGFTLLEILVVLAVLGLVLVALTSGLRFGQLALRAGNRDTVQGNQIAPVDQTLRLLIARAWPGSGGTEAKFNGSASLLSFRTVLPDEFFPSHQARIRTREAEVGLGVDEGHRLILTWLPYYRTWIAPPPRPGRVELLAQLDHVEFAYWDPALKLPPGTWLTAWEGKKIPKLVRVRLVFPPDAGIRWPDIVVATAREP